jgi:hypothetical protein
MVATWFASTPAPTSKERLIGRARQGYVHNLSCQVRHGWSKRSGTVTIHSTQGPERIAPAGDTE